MYLHLGNTALHYAMAYDPEGGLGEFLVSRGANDMLENNLKLSPYDGLVNIMFNFCN